MAKVLLVVDYQVDFVSGTLGFPEAKGLDEGIAQKINEYLDNGDTIICTYDTHTPEYLDTQEGKKLPIPHCIRETEGWKLYGKVGEIVEANSPPKIYKLLKKSFGSDALQSSLLSLLENSMRTTEEIEVEVCGVVTNICVISNAIIAKTALPEAKITVNSSLCASNDKELHNQALNVMKSLQIEVI